MNYINRYKKYIEDKYESDILLTPIQIVIGEKIEDVTLTLDNLSYYDNIIVESYVNNIYQQVFSLSASTLTVEGNNIKIDLNTNNYSTGELIFVVILIKDNFYNKEHRIHYANIIRSLREN